MNGEDEEPTVASNRALIEAYKRDVDRTLILDNLRKTPEQRLRDLEALQRLAEEARGSAGAKLRRE